MVVTRSRRGKNCRRKINRDRENYQERASGDAVRATGTPRTKRAAPKPEKMSATESTIQSRFRAIRLPSNRAANYTVSTAPIGFRAARSSSFLYQPSSSNVPRIATQRQSQ